MKKIIAALLALIFILSVSAGCSGGDPSDTSESKADDSVTEENPGSGDKSGKDDEQGTSYAFNPPTVDKRTYVYDYMVAMSQVKWTATNNIDTKDIAKTLYYKKGVEYEGLPYINLDVDTDLDEFMEVLRWDEATQKYYYDETERAKILGNDCSSAILLSWKRLDPDIPNSTTNTHNIVPLGKKSGVYPVGDYVAGEEKLTKTIIKNNGNEVIYKAYAQLKKGDAILYHGDTGHIRMLVEDPVIKVKGNGEINPGRSHVVCIEQTNSMDASRKDGVNTCWYVNHEYTFTQLIESGYIPVSCNALLSDTFDTYPEIEIQTNNLNTKKTLPTAPSLSGEVVCNYSIQYATVKIIKDDGTVIFEETSKPRCGTFKLAGVKYTLPEGGLPEGNYTYLITIVTACGETEAYRAEFTKQAS